VNMQRRMRCEDQVRRGARMVMLSVRWGVEREREKTEALARGRAKKAPMARERAARPTYWGCQVYSRERRAPRSWGIVSGTIGGVRCGRRCAY